MKPHGNAHFCLLKNRKMEEQVDLQLQEQRLDLQLQKWGLILTNDEPSNDNVEPSEVDLSVDLADFGVSAALSEDSEEEESEVGFFDDDMPGVVEGHSSESFKIYFRSSIHFIMTNFVCTLAFFIIS